MEILSVTLTNFKIHGDRHFQFQPGTNAICGENGAGKTSILEAIAWVLFDYKGDYKTDDLIRNGCPSAQVQVSFVSHRDQRTYQVRRCTRAGYTLYDPQAGQKLNYTRIKEEVLPWLREHLGVAPGTDLADLFARTIGVPQGTFTADFLLSTEKRKPVFDKVLKVEEYQKTYKELSSLEKYGKAETDRLSREIAQYEEALEALQPLQQKQTQLTQEIVDLEAALVVVQQQIQQLSADQVTAQSQLLALQHLKAQCDRTQVQVNAQTQLLEQLQTNVEIAQRSVEICTPRREAFQAFQATEGVLRHLEQQRSQEQTLLKQRQQLVQSSSQGHAELTAVITQIQRCQAAEVEMGQLQSTIEVQATYEQEQQSLSQQIQTCYTWRQTIEREEKRLAQLQKRSKQLQKEIDQLTQLATVIDQLPQLDEQQERYRQQLSRIEAASQFEAELRIIFQQAESRTQQHEQAIEAIAQLLQTVPAAAPQWANAIAMIQTTLNSGSQLQRQLLEEIEMILEDVAEQSQINRIQSQLQQTQAQIQQLRQQQTQYLTLESKQAEHTLLASEIDEVRSHLADLQQHLATEPTLQQQLISVQTQLQALNDPRGRSQLLQREVARQAGLEKQKMTLERSLESSVLQIQTIDQQLETFVNLEAELQTQQMNRETYRSDYELYVEHREIANQFKARQQAFVTAQTELNQLTEHLESLQKQQSELHATCDLEAIAQLQRDFQSAQTQQTKLVTQIPMKRELQQEYEAQLMKLQTQQDKLKVAQADLKHKQKVDRFIKFARKTYKDAGPRITERYVQAVAREADRLFRELLNRPNLALDWTRDYEIIVREGANDRRFLNLSGGEQMCAALAVRLALLKVLADIDVAFFDEPTTNMDRPRRVKLAEAIANIKTFRQLFVISHDDTFEQVTENVIVVERETI
ncbi:MAG: SMC family ATPase [Synechococcales bacterium]|nr:SMC family ATPase [Synechococcales bacterium]